MTPNDEPDDLAAKFVEKHNLKTGFISIISNHIKQQIEQAKALRSPMRDPTSGNIICNQ